MEVLGDSEAVCLRRKCKRRVHRKGRGGLRDEGMEIQRQCQWDHRQEAEEPEEGRGLGDKGDWRRRLEF